MSREVVGSGPSGSTAAAAGQRDVLEVVHDAPPTGSPPSAREEAPAGQPGRGAAAGSGHRRRRAAALAAVAALGAAGGAVLATGEVERRQQDAALASLSLHGLFDGPTPPRDDGVLDGRLRLVNASSVDLEVLAAAVGRPAEAASAPGFVLTESEVVPAGGAVWLAGTARLDCASPPPADALSVQVQPRDGVSAVGDPVWLPVESVTSLGFGPGSLRAAACGAAADVVPPVPLVVTDATADGAALVLELAAGEASEVRVRLTAEDLPGFVVDGRDERARRVPLRRLLGWRVPLGISDCATARATAAAGGPLVLRYRADGEDGVLRDAESAPVLAEVLAAALAAAGCPDGFPPP